MFATNGAGDPTEQLKKMAAYLNERSTSQFDIAVQSIGHVQPPGPPADPYAPDRGGAAWQSVATALSKYGANPDTFNRVNGSYTFLGGPQLSRSSVAQSSLAVVIDPSSRPALHESGTLSGLARMQSDGAIVPVVADADSPAGTDGSLDAKLDDITFSDGEDWPLTTGPNAADYTKAPGTARLSSWRPAVCTDGPAGNRIHLSGQRQDAV